MRRTLLESRRFGRSPDVERLVRDLTNELRPLRVFTRARDVLNIGQPSVEEHQFLLVEPSALDQTLVCQAHIASKMFSARAQLEALQRCADRPVLEIAGNLVLEVVHEIVPVPGLAPCGRMKENTPAVDPCQPLCDEAPPDVCHPERACLLYTSP